MIGSPQPTVSATPRPRRAPPRSSAGRSAVLVAVLLGGAVMTPLPLLHAQETTGAYDLVQFQRRYEAAAADCEAAVLARRADQREYERTINAVQAAVRLGDEAAEAAARTRFFEMSEVIDERQRRVTEQCGEADGVRRDYFAALDRRRRAMEAELAAATAPQRRAEIRGVLADIDARYQELEEDRGGMEVQLVMRPLTGIAPTDTPDAVRNKAAFLERLIAMADSLIADLDDEVERLESRIQRQRSVQNFQGPLDRFEQLRTPVSSGGGGEDDRARTANDSTELGPQSLESRLRNVRDARLQIEHYRDQMRARVREFQDYLERIT